MRSEVDVSIVVGDPGKTIEEGAVLPWNSGGRRLSMYAAGGQGVRLNVPYRSLTERERDIVLHGEPVQRRVTLQSRRTGRSAQLSVNYDNAVAAVERSLRSENERTRRLVQRFLITRVCSVCHGARLRPEALGSQLGGRNIAEISARPAVGSVTSTSTFSTCPTSPSSARPVMGPGFNHATLAVRVDGLTIADVLGLSVDDALQRFAHRAPVIAALRPVSEVGLGYLRLGEPTPSLSGGESQRLRIATRLRSSQLGALYVFDEPSTGLHPLDVATLVGVFDRLLDAGATIIVIDHDLDLLAAADHLIDMGPGGGPDGGRIVAAGTPQEVARAVRTA